MIARAVTGLCFIALLGACGDDLESRQEAVQGMQPSRDEITVREVAPADSEATVTRGAPTENQESPDEGAAMDLPPESLIDTAQGFSADPMDDAAGFDPTPETPSGFAPEPMAAESFED